MAVDDLKGKGVDGKAGCMALYQSINLLSSGTNCCCSAAP